MSDFGSDENGHFLKCGNCGFLDSYDVFDVLGACPGNVFCIECHSEIDSSTGVVILAPCGECMCCREAEIPPAAPRQREMFTRG